MHVLLRVRFNLDDGSQKWDGNILASEKQLTKVHGPLSGNYLDSKLERAEYNWYKQENNAAQFGSSYFF